MDRPRVAAAVATMLDQLRRQYLGSDRRAGQGIRNTSPSGEDQVFQEAGFRPAQTVTVPDQRIIILRIWRLANAGL